MNVLTSILSMLVFVAVLWGFARIWYDEDPVLHHVKVAALWLSAMMICRSGYWDVAQFVLNGHWLTVREFLGGQRFSTVFNVMGLAGGYHLLKAKWWMIPAAERKDWRIWNAWLYPPRSVHLEKD